MPDTQKEIIDILACELGLSSEQIKLTDLLEQDLGADSLDITELAMSIEDDFELVDEIPQDVIEKWQSAGTVQDVIDYVETRLRLTPENV